MRLALALALALLAAGPAEACHRFAHWRYPWPQACGARRAAPRPGVRKPEGGWYVEITRLPPGLIDDAAEREIGLSALRSISPRR